MLSHAKLSIAARSPRSTIDSVPFSRTSVIRSTRFRTTPVASALVSSVCSFSCSYLCQIRMQQGRRLLCSGKPRLEPGLLQLIREPAELEPRHRGLGLA
jgi:hypothetical protein